MTVPSASAVARQLRGHPRLARTRVAAHHHHLRLVITTYPSPLGLEEGQLVVATHERRGRRVGLDVEGRERHCLPHLDRLLLALEQHRLPGPERDATSYQLGRESAAQHFARPGRLLQTGRHVDRVADDGHGATGPHCRGQHLPRVHADREDQVPAEVSHRHRGGHGPLGIVVVRDRDAEHCQQGVPHVLVDGATVLRHDVAQLVKGGVDESCHDLGVGAFGQGREAHDVGEQHCRQLALFDRRGRGPGRDAVEPGPAVPAEPLPIGDRRPARRTPDHGECRPAVPAELKAIRVGLAAARTQVHTLTVARP